MTSIRRSRSQLARNLLKRPSAEPAYDFDAGAARLREAMAQRAPAPAWADAVPMPQRRARIASRPTWICLSVCVVAALWFGLRENAVMPPMPDTAPGHVLAPKAAVSVEPAPPNIGDRPGRADAVARVASLAPRSADAPKSEGVHPQPAAITAAPAITDSVRGGVASSTRVAPIVDQRTDQPPGRSGQVRTRAERTRSRSAATRLPPTPEDQLEMEELARAEQQLLAEPAAALALVQSGRSRFPRGYFEEERRVVEVVALTRLGRRAEAQARSWAFFNDYPRSPYRHRIEDAVRTPL